MKRQRTLNIYALPDSDDEARMKPIELKMSCKDKRTVASRKTSFFDRNALWHCYSQRLLFDQRSNENGNRFSKNGIKIMYIWIFFPTIFLQIKCILFFFRHKEIIPLPWVHGIIHLTFHWIEHIGGFGINGCWI